MVLMNLRVSRKLRASKKELVKNEQSLVNTRAAPYRGPIRNIFSNLFLVVGNVCVHLVNRLREPVVNITEKVIQSLLPTSLCYF